MEEDLEASKTKKDLMHFIVASYLFLLFFAIYYLRVTLGVNLY